MGRDRCDRNAWKPRGVERAKIGKEVRRRLDEVSGRRKIEPGARPSALERATEIEHGFVRLDAGRGEPKRGLRRIM